MTKVFAALIVSAFAMPAFADETCDMAALQQQGEALGAYMTQLATENPERMMEVTTEMQAIQAEVQTSGDMAPLCAFYEELLAEADS